MNKDLRLYRGHFILMGQSRRFRETSIEMTTDFPLLF